MGFHLHHLHWRHFVDGWLGTRVCSEYEGITVFVWEVRICYSSWKIGSSSYPCDHLLGIRNKLSSHDRHSYEREKRKKIFNTVASLLTLSSCSIRFLAKFIGQIVARFPGVKCGPLWYRNMENDKIEVLKMSKGNFDANIQLSEMALAESFW